MSLEELIGDEKETQQQPSAEEKAQAEAKAAEQTKIDEEAKKKQEQLANLNKAIVESNNELKRIRKGVKAAKSGEDEEEELPELDHTDPSVKRWQREIRDSVDPVQAEIEKEKEEVRSYALQDFLKSKPALSQDPEKVKELMDEYNRLSSGKITERQKDGVTIYLNKAYASLHSSELIAAANGRRVQQAKTDLELSDIAVDSGTTTYNRERSTSDEELDSEDVAMITSMYGSVEEYRKTLKDSKSK